MGKGGRVGGGLMQGASPGMLGGAMIGAGKKAGLAPQKPEIGTPAVNKSMFSQLPPKPGGMPQRNARDPGISRGNNVPIPAGARKEITPQTPQRYQMGMGGPSQNVDWRQLLGMFGR